MKEYAAISLSILSELQRFLGELPTIIILSEGKEVPEDMTEYLFLIFKLIFYET